LSVDDFFCLLFCDFLFDYYRLILNFNELIETSLYQENMMRKVLFALLLSLTVFAGFAQVSKQGIDSCNIDTAGEREVIYNVAEQMPSFPGGEVALMRFINSHIVYPSKAARCNKEGRVIVQFVVTREGKVDKVKIAKGVEASLDKEAIRVCRMLPKFIPAKHNGKTVSMWYTLTINFSTGLPNKNN
jgi:TonB family protein